MMSSRKAAPRAAAPDIAVSLAALLSPARAAASRKNGAKSKGPRSTEGKARSAQNALKHGLRAERFVVVGDEDAQEFAALEAALLAELAPEGALQSLLAGRIVRAAWRLQRADQIEAELFAREMHSPFGEGDLGLALIRDGHGARAFDTLLRYRGAAQAEFTRALRLLKALQAETQAIIGQEAPGRRAPALLEAAPEQAMRVALPNQPEARGIADGSAASAAAGPVPDEVPAPAAPRGLAAGGADARGRPDDASPEPPIEPECRRNAGETQAMAAACPVSRAVPERKRAVATAR